MFECHMTPALDVLGILDASGVKCSSQQFPILFHDLALPVVLLLLLPSGIGI